MALCVDDISLDCKLASKEGVTVREVTETDLAITTSSLSPISWVFEITTNVSHKNLATFKS